jgi:DNA-binding FadR family transcriptional regulator
MADKLATAEKKRDKAEKDFDQAQSVLERAFHKYNAEKNTDKKVALLRHVSKACHEAIQAGEDCIDADNALEKAEKESEE